MRLPFCSSFCPPLPSSLLPLDCTVRKCVGVSPAAAHSLSLTHSPSVSVSLRRAAWQIERSRCSAFLFRRPIPSTFSLSFPFSSLASLPSPSTSTSGCCRCCSRVSVSVLSFNHTSLLLPLALCLQNELHSTSQYTQCTAAGNLSRK